MIKKEGVISDMSIIPAVPGNPNANPPIPDVTAIKKQLVKHFK